MGRETPQDVIDGNRIAAWNITNGAEWARLKDDLGRALDAFPDPASGPIAAAVDLRLAGKALGAASRALLTLPEAGVPNYDDPEREGLALFAQAGDAAAEYRPTDAGDNAHNIYMLIEAGRACRRESIKWTQDLIKRFR